MGVLKVYRAVRYCLNAPLASNMTDSIMQERERRGISLPRLWLASAPRGRGFPDCSSRIYSRPRAPPSRQLLPRFLHISFISPRFVFPPGLRYRFVEEHDNDNPLVDGLKHFWKFPSIVFRSLVSQFQFAIIPAAFFSLCAEVNCRCFGSIVQPIVDKSRRHLPAGALIFAIIYCTEDDRYN